MEADRLFSFLAPASALRAAFQPSEDPRGIGRSVVVSTTPKNWQLGLHFHNNRSWFGHGTYGVEILAAQQSPMKRIMRWFKLSTTSVRGSPLSPKTLMAFISGPEIRVREPSKSMEISTIYDVAMAVLPESPCRPLRMWARDQHSIQNGKASCCAHIAMRGCDHMCCGLMNAMTNPTTVLTAPLPS